MSQARALVGARIFDGGSWHDRNALLVRDGSVQALVPSSDIPAEFDKVVLDGGMLVPGFIDLQVNGGGGVLLNAEPTVEGIRTIYKAHARFGTTALLPTLITDTPAVTAQAVAAGIAATREAVPGFLGLHLEGPHLSLARKGAHDPALIRPMEEEDLAALLAARPFLPNLLTTLAPENVTAEQITRLAAGGVVVSLGHTDAGYATSMSAVDAGGTMATHLFNAMSQLSNREPGLVGAALGDGRLWAGLIADGIHVHPETIALALRAKRQPSRIFLVTDAMALTGTTQQSFTLNERIIRRSGGALRLEDGTLAGADLTMIAAVSFMHREIGLPLDECLRMASLYPAQAIGVAESRGWLAVGAVADFVHLSDELQVRETWIGGARAFAA